MGVGLQDSGDGGMSNTPHVQTNVHEHLAAS